MATRRGKIWLIMLLVIILPLSLAGCGVLDWLFGGGGEEENLPPVASFTFSPASPFAGDSVNFDATDSSDPDGDIVTFEWDFGDGNSGTSSTTTHTYTSSGTYTVTLTVMDDQDMENSTSHSITVKKKSKPGENEPPAASFTFSPQEPKVGDEVNFDASSSNDPDGEVVSYRWTMEPGSTRMGATVTYIFREAGSYPVALEVEDDQGATDTTSKRVTVVEKGNQNPVPLFSYSPEEPQLEEQISFDASESYDPDGEIVSYEWDFGDGSSATGVTATHTFNNPGNYLVTLTVTDDEAATNKQTIPIFLSSGQAQVVGSFASPGGDPRGLAWDGSYLWCADIGGEGTLYKINPSNGNVVSSILSPGIYPLGLAWDGKYLWNIDPVEGRIFQIDPSNGQVVNDPIDIPGGDPTGLAYGNSYLWVADGDGQTIYKVDPSDGSVVSSISSPEEFPKGLAWDGSHLWNVDMVNGIYRINSNTGSTASFYELTPGPRSEGAAWDGTHLWIADSEEDKIYKISF